MLAFEQSSCIREIVVVARESDFAAVKALAKQYAIQKFTAVVAGSETRALSVRAGVEKINPKARYIAIHDGARCLILPEQIELVCRAAYRHRAATAAHGVSDTVKTATKRGFIASTIDRNTVYLASTPQVFHAELYRAALATVKDADALTDDNQLMERLGYPVKLVDCGADNIKITTPPDIARVEWILRSREEHT